MVKLKNEEQLGIYDDDTAYFFVILTDLTMPTLKIIILKIGPQTPDYCRRFKGSHQNKLYY